VKAWRPPTGRHSGRCFVSMNDKSPQPASQLLERASRGLHDSLFQRLPHPLDRMAPILDVGCGTGAWLARLSRHGFTNLTGLDYDVTEVRGVPARIQRVDLNQPAWFSAIGQFALITAIEVVEHVENLGIFFDGLRHLLQPGGTILLTTPNVESLPARIRFLLLNQLKHFDEMSDLTHIVPILTSTLPRILTRHGLRITDSWGYPGNHRTVTSRARVNLVCSGLRVFLPEPIGGDNLCLRLQAA
jgi:2-polyprenyl-3-methyl-5-hydroxy-6-metoxy-1,4-benzoquinol methylase